MRICTNTRTYYLNLNFKIYINKFIIIIRLNQNYLHLAITEAINTFYVDILSSLLIYYNSFFKFSYIGKYIAT